ncbi:MAG: accessory Sec system protein Asp2 [Lachnospiraceae bacterium]|nr:accessory Sec system protein Asp2 [Lachnospiraceae bacterium]
MFDHINVLQLGPENLSEKYNIPKEITWMYEPAWEAKDVKKFLKQYRSFDVAIIDRELSEEEVERIIKLVRAYGLFVFDDSDFNFDYLMKSRGGQKIKRDNFQDFIDERLIFYYTNSYGEHFRNNKFHVNRRANTSIKFSGYNGIEISVDQNDNYQQLGYWRFNIPIEVGQGIDFWLEYEKDDSLQLEMDIYVIRAGAVDFIQQEYHIENDELETNEYITIFNNTDARGLLNVSLQAKGHGNIKIMNLHDRWSRFDEGVFLPGGERLITSNREEAFFYFEPGDLKPPLNVYFSGYKTMESFEGYGIMRGLKSPFLLVADQRLEGGGFYIGSQEYEDMIKNKILDTMKELGFTEKDLVFSGLSMGTSGAMYYGALIGPQYVILGKPLASLGTIAENERVNRPGGFPTSLDVLGKNMGDLSAASIEGLNKKYWDNFANGDWSHTTFIISYMYEDDYDGNAYQEILSRLHDTGTRVFGKGLHGRHNDDTTGIVNWYYKQFKIVAQDHYGREF